MEFLSCLAKSVKIIIGDGVLFCLSSERFMGRPPRNLPTQLANVSPLPAAESALDAVIHALVPLIRLLVVCGVDYVRFAAVLKQTFIEQSQLELFEQGITDTDSALSLLSGVHRKDVRFWRDHGLSERIARKVSISSQVFAHWSQNPLYRNRLKNPKALPRMGENISFESLVRQITQDVHPFTVLAEMVRLGLVTVVAKQGVDWVIPSERGFVPPPGSVELLELFAANLGDHAASAVRNLRGGTTQLEQSVFASGLTQESAEQLDQLSRKLWQEARQEMIAAATRLYLQDKGQANAHSRIRFGHYFWSEALAESETLLTPSAVNAERELRD